MEINEVLKTLLGMLIVGLTLVPLTVMCITGLIGAGLSAYFADYTMLAFYAIIILIGLGVGWFIYHTKLQTAVLGGLTAVLLVGIVFTITGFTGVAIGLLYGQLGVLIASIILILLLALTFWIGNYFAMASFFKVGG